MDPQELHRQIILDHYKNPQNKVDKCPEGYQAFSGSNPSCGDELEVYIKKNDDQTFDLKFQGSGCSICCSSASVMCNELHNLKVSQIEAKITSFNDLIQNKEVAEDLFEDAVAYSGIGKFPARYKCAFLGWKTVSEALELTSQK